MSKYTVRSLSTDETIGTFTSVTAAYNAAEQFYQSNLDQTLQFIKASLRWSGRQYVQSCHGSNDILVIKKI